MAHGKSHHARILERLQRSIAKHPEHAAAFTPRAPRAEPGQLWTMNLQNDTALTLRLGTYYGVEVDYSTNPVQPGQASVATIHASWGPPCGFYMIFSNEANPSDWAGLLGLITAGGQMQIVEQINSNDIVNHVSPDLTTDDLRSS